MNVRIILFFKDVIHIILYACQKEVLAYPGSNYTVRNTVEKVN